MFDLQRRLAFPCKGKHMKQFFAAFIKWIVFCPLERNVFHAQHITG
jgi:hypothetical protein